MNADLDLITCPLCLRVRRGSEWMEAEHVIRETRSYELEALPQLRAHVCDFCAESIFSPRTQVGDFICGLTSLLAHDGKKPR